MSRAFYKTTTPQNVATKDGSHLCNYTTKKPILLKFFIQICFDFLETEVKLFVISTCQSFTPYSIGKKEIRLLIHFQK